MALPLTRRKEAWVAQFKPKALRGKPLNPSAAVEVRYYSVMADLIRKMSATTEKELQKLFAAPHAEAYFAQDDTISSQARIVMNALRRKFEDLFSLKAADISQAMVDDSDRQSSIGLKASLKDVSGGLTLNTNVLTGDLQEVIKASIVENVGLIKSIASRYLDQVQGAVMRSITSEAGLSYLVPFLRNYEGVTLRRARNIATDQTRKAYNNINKIRLQKLGMDEFEWLHSAGGQHPRKEHVAMSGNIYSLKNPPVIDSKTGERGIPGQLINCRCRMVPVIRFGDAGDSFENVRQRFSPSCT